MRRRPSTAAWPLALGCLLTCFAILYPTISSHADNGQSRPTSSLAKANADETGVTTSRDVLAAAAPPDQEESDPPALPVHEFCDLVETVALRFDLPVTFFANLLWQESRFDYTAVSPAGAQGVAQFMPATAEAMDLKDPFDPTEAVPASATLLRQLLKQFGNLGLAAAAYNAGPKRVIDWRAKRSRLPKETRDYVATITGVPIDGWRKSGVKRVVFQTPPRMPCARNVATSKPALGENRTPGSKRGGVRAAAQGKAKMQSRSGIARNSPQATRKPARAVARVASRS